MRNYWRDRKARGFTGRVHGGARFAGPHEGSMHLSVAALGKGYTFRAEPYDSTEALKHKLFDLADQQMLVFAGKRMDDGKTCSDYNMQTGASLYCVLRLPGMTATTTEEERRQWTLWPAPDGMAPTTANWQPNSFDSMAAESQAKKEFRATWKSVCQGAYPGFKIWPVGWRWGPNLRCSYSPQGDSIYAGRTFIFDVKFGTMDEIDWNSHVPEVETPTALSSEVTRLSLSSGALALAPLTLRPAQITVGEVKERISKRDRIARDIIVLEGTDNKEWQDTDLLSHYVGNSHDVYRATLRLRLRGWIQIRMVTPFYHPQVSEDGRLRLSAFHPEPLWQLSDVPVVLEELFSRQATSWGYYQWVNHAAFIDCQSHTEQFLAQTLCPANNSADPTVAEGIVVPLSKLAVHLERLANNQEALPDVAFVISGGSEERVFAHKALLAAKSPVLGDLLGEEKDKRKDDMTEVRLQPADFGVNASTFAAFLRTVVYAHTHDAQARKLLDLAQEHGLDAALRQFADQEEKEAEEPRDASELEVDQLKLMTDHRLADVDLVVDGRKASAHKFLLMARSKFLRTMFTSGMKEGQEETTEVELHDIRFPILRHVLEYIYTDKINYIPDDLVELLMAADMFQLARLKTLCCKALAEVLDVGNAAWLFDVASRYRAEPLRQVALHFIMSRWSQVSALFSEEDGSNGPPVGAAEELKELYTVLFSDNDQ